MDTNQSIHFGSICWEKDQNLFLQVLEIEDFLLKNIDLSTYGDGLKKIVFVPMGVAKDDPIHKEKAQYSSRSKKLEIHKHLSIENFDKITEKEFLKNTAQAFYNAIQIIKKRSIKNFDTNGFLKAIESLFIKKGWLLAKELA